MPRTNAWSGVIGRTRSDRRSDRGRGTAAGHDVRSGGRGLLVSRHDLRSVESSPRAPPPRGSSWRPPRPGHRGCSIAGRRHRIDIAYLDTVTRSRRLARPRADPLPATRRRARPSRAPRARSIQMTPSRTRQQEQMRQPPAMVRPIRSCRESDTSEPLAQAMRLVLGVDDPVHHRPSRGRWRMCAQLWRTRGRCRAYPLDRSKVRHVDQYGPCPRQRSGQRRRIPLAIEPTADR